MSVQVFVSNDNYDLFDARPRTSVIFTHNASDPSKPNELFTFLVEPGVVPVGQSDPPTVARRLLEYLEPRNPDSRTLVRLRALARALSMPPPPKAAASA